MLAVLIYHTLPIPDPHPSAIVAVWNSVVMSCWVGVDLFFVLSGLLITRVLWESIAEPNYFRDFYIRRALRIAPLYFAAVFCAIYLIPWVVPAAILPPMSRRLAENQVWVWVFLQNYLQARAPHQLPGLGHFWTLAVEEQFYLVWPAVVAWLSRTNLVIVCASVCFLEPFARLVCLGAGYSTGAIRQLTYLRVDSLLAGALLYLVLDQKMLRQFVPTVLQILAISALGALSLIFVRHGFLPYESPETAVVGHSAVAILCLALLYACVNDVCHAGQVFSAPLLRWFGKYSYGIYVFSVPAILGFGALVGNSNRIPNPFVLAMTRLLFSGLVSIGLAWVSFQVLESPFLRLKSRLRKPEYSAATLAEAAL